MMDAASTSRMIQWVMSDDSWLRSQVQGADYSTRLYTSKSTQRWLVRDMYGLGTDRQWDRWYVAQTKAEALHRTTEITDAAILPETRTVPAFNVLDSMRAIVEACRDPKPGAALATIYAANDAPAVASILNRVFSATRELVLIAVETSHTPGSSADEALRAEFEAELADLRSRKR